jgi:hypothetical protein
MYCLKFEFRLSFKTKHYVCGLNIMLKIKFKDNFEEKVLSLIINAKI